MITEKLVKTYIIPDCEELNKVLKQKILDFGDDQDRRTNVKAFMTTYFINRSPKYDFYPFTEFKEFYRQAHGDYITSLYDLNIKQDVLYSPIQQIWGAVYRKGDYTIEHNHSPFHISFVYYVEAGEDSAPLIFRSIDAIVKPKDGMLVLFPSWLKHEVPEHTSVTDRVVIAGNSFQ